MIEELDTYALSDFLLFSQDTYFRLFELYNRDVWPVHPAALALGIGLLWMMIRPHGRYTPRLIAVVLVLAWAWVGWAFHFERYTTINPAASYFAALFGLEVLLLVWLGLIRGRLCLAESGTAMARIGLIVLAFSIFINPLIGLVAGRTWTQLSIFGIGPDPTAMATVGLLLGVRGIVRWVLVAPALIWCILTTLTAIAMGSIEGIGPALVVALTCGVALRDALQGR